MFEQTKKDMQTEMALKPQSLNVKQVIDLISERIEAVKGKDIALWNEALDVDPPAQWVKKNNGVEYIPIRIVETMLQTYYGTWQSEIVGEPKLIANSIVVTCQIKVWHPVLQQWITHAGVGAVPVELAKGSSPMEIENLNKMAIQKNAPAALSYAVSNAAKKLGRIFGSHLNSYNAISTGNIYESA